MKHIDLEMLVWTIYCLALCGLCFGIIYATDTMLRQIAAL